MLLILLAKGYTVTRGRIKPVTATKIAIFMGIYSIIYGAIFFYEQMVREHVYNIFSVSFTIVFCFQWSVLWSWWSVVSLRKLAWLWLDISSYTWLDLVYVCNCVYINTLSNQISFLHESLPFVQHLVSSQEKAIKCWLDFTFTHFRFISAPVVILISTFVVPKWMREKIINSVELFIAFYAHTVFFVSPTDDHHFLLFALLNLVMRILSSSRS